MALVTIDAAKAHLRIDDLADDAEVTAKLAQAVAIVADYLESDAATLEAEHGEDGNTFVHAAVLLILTSLFYERTEDPLTRGALNLLARLRSPGVW